MTADRLYEDLRTIHASGRLPLAHDLLNLIDRASECADHFNDGRITLAFSLQVVMEGLLEKLDKLNSGEPAVLQRLLGSMRDVAAELKSPSGADEMLAKSSALIKSARAWIDTSN